MKQMLSGIVRSIVPGPVWNAYLRARGFPQIRTKRSWDHMTTIMDPTPLLNGRFGAMHDRFSPINPAYDGTDSYRYMHYNICYFAELCRDVPGDFVMAGVSFGATAKIVYEFVGFPALGKTMHLIDPFMGTERGRVAKNYNTSVERVRDLFPQGKIKIHQAPIPIDLGDIKLAFVVCDTGHLLDADVAALPGFYKALSPGGVWISLSYGYDTAKYAPTLERLGVTPLWLPSGQGVIIKR